MRLVDADALKEAFNIEELYWGKRIIDLINNAPTITDRSVEIAKKSIELGRRVGRAETELYREKTCKSKDSCNDLISRQDAIDALEEQLWYLQKLDKNENPTAESKWYGVNWARNMIADLPSAQKEGGAV